MAPSNSKPKKKLKGYQILLIVLGSIVGFFVLIAIVNFGFNLALRSYIKSFKAVDYDHQLIPSLNEEGDYVFTTDGDLKVMQITDFHLGGGFLSYEKDKKAINCAMTMIQNEKPDLVIYTGDNIFAVPYISGTINNYMVSKTFILMNERLSAYWTTTFGNHDSEAFDYFNRYSLSKLYMNPRFGTCIYQSTNGITGESNSLILVKKNDGSITKALVLIDSNAYPSSSISDAFNWNYDTIHDDQVAWAKAKIEYYTAKNNNVTVKSLFFFHIPISEYEMAYQELVANSFNDTANARYISGSCDELVNETLKGRIWYGGWKQSSTDISKADNLFEELSYSMEGCFCGHDHVNNLQVEYKGVLLSYGLSVDYLAYTDIDKFGKQRGSTIITVSPDGSFTAVHKNYYTSGYSSEKGIETVNLTDDLYPGALPENAK